MAIARRSAHMNVMVEAAQKAGRALVRDFGEVENLQVSKKGPGDFVSTADHKAEKLILSILEKARPNYTFLMEESGEKKGTDKDFRWIVDPLDGTTNFLHGIPHWAVAIALEKEGEIVAGVIYDPVKDELFTAEKGTGAFVNNRRLRVSPRQNTFDALIVMGTEKSPSFTAEVAAIAPVCSGLRRSGSACLDLAYVAAGRYDAFWERGLHPWDCAAGSLMVREAGGTVTDLSGGKDYIAGRNIIAANATLHAELMKKIRTSPAPAAKASTAS
jgi:myo-inositol-1(or 4)-monophosphatase